MKKIVSILAVASSMVGGGLAPVMAQTAQYGYASAVPLSGNSGTDFFGNAWLWSQTVGGAPGPGAGYSVWGTPGLGLGNAFYEGAAPSDSFAITFLYPISQILTASINQTAYSNASFSESTRLQVGTQAWDATYAFNNTIVFTAPKGVEATFGESFFINVVFNEKNLTGNNTAFTATWAGGAVPESSTWLMMLGGFAALGLVGSRRKAAHVAA